MTGSHVPYQSLCTGQASSYTGCRKYNRQITSWLIPETSKLPGFDIYLLVNDAYDGSHEILLPYKYLTVKTAVLSIVHYLASLTRLHTPVCYRLLQADSGAPASISNVVAHADIQAPACLRHTQKARTQRTLLSV